jgi:hypothetical protein
MSLTAKVLLAGWCIALIPIARKIEGDKHWGWYERRLKLLPLVLVGCSKSQSGRGSCHECNFVLKRDVHLHFSKFLSYLLSWYCSFVTCSSQFTATPLRLSCTAIWVIAVVGVAPCQCLIPGGIQTTSPLRMT